MKIDKTIKREVAYIGAFVLILSALLQAVFLIIGKWDYRVLCGNLLSGTFAVLNFFLLGVTVQKATTRTRDKAAELMKFSSTMRMLFLFAVALLGALLPSCFNLIAVLVPLFFPRVAIMLRPMIRRGDAEVPKAPGNDPEKSRSDGERDFDLSESSDKDEND